VAVKRPFLPQTRREWLDIGRVLCIMTGIGTALFLAQEYIGRFAWLLPLLVLLAEPFVKRQRALRAVVNGAHGLHRGRLCTVVDVTADTLRVRLDDTIWAARCLDTEGARVGQQVYVHGGDGLVVHVSKERPAQSIQRRCRTTR